MAPLLKRFHFLLALLFLSGCPHPTIHVPPPSPCDGTTKLRVHFYDVAQGLAALVDLPDGQHILVDTGESASRAGCGAPCKTASQHLVEQLGADRGGAPVAMVWITHQHSDHLGGAPAVLSTIAAKTYVDNGTELNKAQVVKAHDAATTCGAQLAVIDPQHTTVPMEVAEPVHLRAVVPSQWPGSCASDPNNCSIGLRIDFCASSIRPRRHLAAWTMSRATAWGRISRAIDSPIDKGRLVLPRFS